MPKRTFEPVQSGHDASAPQHGGETPQKEERQQAGTPPTLEESIDSAIDKVDHTEKPPGTQAYSIHWLVSHYPVSVAIAAIIANELGMGDA